MSKPSVPMSKIHSILLYSPFGLGKSSFLASLVETLGLKASLYTAETSTEYDALVAAGQVRRWKFNTRNDPFATTQRACDGYWPKDPLDPASPLQAAKASDWAEWPIRIYEGLATIADYLAGNYVVGGMANRIGRGEQIGPTDSGELIRLVDGDTVVGGLSRSNYGFVQKEMLSLVARTQRYPGYIIWTAHEDDVAEKKGKVATGRTIMGPQVFGSALTQYIGKDYADVWRIVGVATDFTDPATKEVRRVIERRLYLKEHADPLDPALIAKGRNSAGWKRQGTVPDFIRLTDPEKPGQPRADAAKILVDLLKL